MLGNSETYKQNYHRFDKDNLCEDWKQRCGTVDSEALYSLTLTQQNIVTRWCVLLAPHIDLVLMLGLIDSQNHFCDSSSYTKCL